MTSAPVILVAGAISHDYLVYPMSAQRAGLRSRPGGDDSRVVVRSGGAALVSDLLTAVAPEYGIEVLGPVAQSNGTSSYKSNATSLVDLEPQRSSVPGKLSFGVVQVRHVGDHSTWQAPPTSDAIKAAPDTVIITGSSDAPGDVESAVDLLERVRPRYIIYHMTRPLAVGRLWDVIRNGPKTSNGIPEPDHLFVVVDAEALRAEGINLSQGLSWEATSEDFVRNLGSNGRLDTLVTCPNLIVRFGSEGVIHHRGRDAVNPRLYFHPRRMECESVTATAPHMVKQLTTASSPKANTDPSSVLPLRSLLGLRLASLVVRDRIVCKLSSSGSLHLEEWKILASETVRLTHVPTILSTLRWID